MRRVAERWRQRVALATQLRIIDPIIGKLHPWESGGQYCPLLNWDSDTHLCVLGIIHHRAVLLVSSTQPRQWFASTDPGYLQYRIWCSINEHHFIGATFAEKTERLDSEQENELCSHCTKYGSHRSRITDKQIARASLLFNKPLFTMPALTVSSVFQAEW